MIGQLPAGMEKNQVKRPRMPAFQLIFLFILLPWPCSPAQAEDPLAGLAHRFELVGHRGQVSQIAFVAGADDLLVSAGYDDKTIRLWDLGKRIQLDQAEVSFGVRDLVVAPDGKSLEILTNTGSIRTIPLVQRRLGQPKSHWGQAGRYGRLAISRDGRFYAIVSRNQPVTIWSADRRRRHQSYRGTEDFRAVDFAEVANIVAAADGTNLLSIWDILAQEGFGAKQTFEISGIEPRIGTWDLAFSQDGRQLATTHIDGHLTTWLLTAPGTSARQTRTLDLPQSAFGVVFSPDGQLVMASCQDGSVYLWSTGSGKLVREYRGGIGSLLSLAVDRQGTRMAAGSLRGHIVVWD